MGSFRHWTGERYLLVWGTAGLSVGILSMPSVPGLLLREADRFVLNRVLSDNKGISDRKVKLRDSRPLHYKPLPQGSAIRASEMHRPVRKTYSTLVSIAEVNLAGSPFHGRKHISADSVMGCDYIVMPSSQLSHCPSAFPNLKLLA